jgi:hypothetical protein
VQEPDAVNAYFGGLGTRPPRPESGGSSATDGNGFTDIKDTIDCPKGAGGLECSGRGE